MTQPGVNYPTDPITPSQEEVANSGKKGTAPIPQDYNALDEIMRLATGNQQLITRPGLLQAMQANNVSVSQAGEINNYMVGLDASNQVRAARVSGAKISLTTEQESSLQALGDDYSDVVAAPPAAVTTTSAADIAPAADVTSTKKKSSGFLASAGSFFHHIASGAVDIVNPAKGTPESGQVNAVGSNPVLQTVNKLPGDVPGLPSGSTITGAASAGLNVVQANLSQYAQENFSGGAGSGGGFNKAAAISQQQSAAMIAAGYNPDSAHSVLAYQAKGYAHTDTSDLAAGWDSTTPGLYGWTGTQAVTQAEQFLSDPTKYQTGIVNNTTMTPLQKEELLSDPRFATLVAEVGGRSATLGNEFARLAGLDPVKNPEAYAITSAGVDTAAAFVIDPINVAGATYQAAKYSAIGLRDIGDSDDIRSALDATSHNPIKVATVRGAQSFIDDMNTVRHGLDEGTEAGKTAAAMAYAHANAATPGWMGLSQDVMGASRLGVGGVVEHNVAPITDLAEFTEYLASKGGLSRLTSGQAALESKLMPGMMSAFGYRYLKGNVAAALVGRSRALDLRLRSVLDDLEVNPENAVDAETGEKIVQHIQTNPAGDMPATAQPGEANTGAPDTGAPFGNNPQANMPAGAAGEVNTGSPIVQSVPASQVRGMANSAEHGDARLKSLTGMSPSAIANRARLAARRLSTNLPKSTAIELGDPEGADKVLKTGLTELSRSDAYLLAAQYARGGEGVQKAIIDGVNQQVVHAAGAGTTEAGRDFAATLPDLNAQHYGHLGNEQIVDPRTGTKADAAITIQQLRPTFRLVGFNDVHRISAKVGLWQQTVGRVFNNQYADIFQDAIRQAFLIKPNIGVRNMIEGQGNIAARGQYGHFLQAKAMLVDASKAAGDAAVTAAKREGTTDVKALRQIRRDAAGEVLRNRKVIVDKATQALALDRVGSLYRTIVKKTMDPARYDMLQDTIAGRHAEEWRPILNGYSDGVPRDALDPHGISTSSPILNDGLVPQKLVRSGYNVGPTSGARGADRYAHSLAMYFGQDADLDHAVLEAVQNKSNDMSGIVDAMKAPHLAASIDSAKRAHQFTDVNGVTQRAVTAEQKDLALEQWARTYVDNAKYLLTDANENHIQSVADYISEHGRAPNATWLTNNLSDDQRAKGALGAEWRAVALNGKLGFARGLLDSGGKLFKYLVEDPIKRTTSEPAMLMNLAEQRLRLSGVSKQMADDLHETSLEPMLARHRFEMDKLADNGGTIDQQAALHEQHAGEIDVLRTQSDDTADNIMYEAAYKRAYAQTESMIDDPTLKTQADVVGRNFLMFSRAVNAFARRWGGMFLEDPTRLRKLMLVNEGMHHAGFTYVDANGNVNFTYPGSDVAMQAMGRLDQIVPGLGTGVQYGMSGALTGQVNMIAPGMDNPGRFSLSPMLTIPSSFLQKLAPQDQQLFDQINTALNGSSANDAKWYSTLVPGIVSKWTAADATDRNSALNSATVSAVMNLEEADPYYNTPDSELPPGAKRIVPGPSATPQDVATYLHNIQQQVRNQLYLRAAFGEFAPAAPGLPDESLPGDQTDPLFSASGVKNLDAEYKVLLNEAGGNRALATSIFVAQNPDRLVYTEPTSVSTTSKAYLPDTKSAENWIDSNRSFISSYPSVAAYFVPQQPGNFDLAAYQAQIQTGLRQKETPSEFLTAYMNTAAANTYYASLDAKNAAVAKALDTGNTKQATAIRSAFNTWNAQFNATNPTWAANEANLPVKEENARTQVTELTKLIGDPNAPSVVKSLAPKLSVMIASFQNQQQWLTTNNGSTAADIAADQAELAQYEGYMTNIVGTDPNLTNIYNGVFKPLNFTPPGG